MDIGRPVSLPLVLSLSKDERGLAVRQAQGERTPCDPLVVRLSNRERSHTASSMSYVW